MNLHVYSVGKTSPQIRAILSDFNILIWLYIPKDKS